MIEKIDNELDEAIEYLYEVYDVYSTHVTNALYILADGDQTAYQNLVLDLVKKHKILKG